jgi:hypothetical protein
MIPTKTKRLYMSRPYFRKIKDSNLWWYYPVSGRRSKVDSHDKDYILRIEEQQSFADTVVYDDDKKLVGIIRYVNEPPERADKWHTESVWGDHGQWVSKEYAYDYLRREDSKNRTVAALPTSENTSENWGGEPLRTSDNAMNVPKLTGDILGNEIVTDAFGTQIQVDWVKRQLLSVVYPPDLKGYSWATVFFWSLLAAVMGIFSTVILIKLLNP